MEPFPRPNALESDCSQCSLKPACAVNMWEQPSVGRVPAAGAPVGPPGRSMQQSQLFLQGINNACGPKHWCRSAATAEQLWVRDLLERWDAPFLPGSCRLWLDFWVIAQSHLVV